MKPRDSDDRPPASRLRLMICLKQLSTKFSRARKRGVFHLARMLATPKPSHAIRIAALLLATIAPVFAADPSPAARGREVYQKWCTPCHGTGLGKAGTEAAAAHGIKPAVLEERTNLTSKLIETAVRNGLSFMPRFRKTEISNADLAAIVAYLIHK